MKQLFTFLFLAISAIAFSQAPQNIPYQAVVRNTDGSIMSTTAVTITFKIHDNSATGTVVYEETHTTITNAQGLISLNVGNGTVVSGTFSGINWGVGNKFLHVLMNAGSGLVDLGTQQMMSVPYAFHSKSADVALSANNGYSRVSFYGDTLFFADNSFIIIPGISAANFQEGCTDLQACNYNPSVEINDGSCLYIAAPCNDGNINTVNDSISSSCICVGKLKGCNNPSACNFNVFAEVDDGSCLYSGLSCNDNFLYTINDLINNECICQGASVMYTSGDGLMDIDGNFYPSIVINGQEWMQENLNVSKYRNGDPINTGLGNYAWSVTNSGAYTSANFGKLYNHWAVVDQRGVCPTGWHVPSTSEWSLLVNFIDPVSNGGYYSIFFDETYSNAAGGRMKSTSSWAMPNIGASNESGFSAFPTGFRTEDDSFVTSNCIAGWWTSDPSGFYPDSFEVYCDLSDVTRRGGTYNRQTGVSIRCIKN